jgi:two-component sensor histidine kinase
MTTTTNLPAELLEKVSDRIEQKAFQFTYYLSISAIFLWLIWLVVDFQLLEDSLALILVLRIVLSIGAVITTFLMYKKKINSTIAQYLLYIPALSFLAVLFNCVPEAVLLFYTMSGVFMVVVSGFVFFIMPPFRTMFFGLFAILIYFVLLPFIGIHSINQFFLNGGILYLSMTVFIVVFTIVRYRSLENSIKNELLVSYTNNLLQEQQKVLESQNVTLEKTVLEKEVLLKEIHHRVKNNLQIISSLLNLYTTDDVQVNKILQNSRSRIHAMALLHENLYKSDNFQHIDVCYYIELLMDDLKVALFVDSIEISIQKSDEPIMIDMKVAIPLGLIVNELVTNSVKHAFGNTENAKISILLHKNQKNIQIVLADNGRGFSQEAYSQNPETLGLRLVKGLVGQIGGTVEFGKENPGTRVTITI